MAPDERNSISKFDPFPIFGLYADLRKIQDLGDFRDEAQSSPERRLMSKSCYYCPSGPTSMALDERNSISKFDTFPWFSACTPTCEKFRIWVIFGMKLKVVLRVDWCRNPVTTVLVDPLAWLWTKEIQFQKFDPFPWFSAVRGLRKIQFGWFSKSCYWRKIQDLGDFRDEAQSSPQSRLMSKSCYYCPSGPTSMAQDERNSISKFEIQDLGDFRDEAQSSPQSRLMSKSCYYCPSGPTSMALDERNSISKFDPFPWFSACWKFRIWVISGWSST